MAEIKKISTELQLLDKFLDTSGSAGSSGSVLTSTTTGTSWVSAGTPGTGIYLPLAGGNLTGNLTLTNSSSNVVSRLDNLGNIQIEGGFFSGVTASTTYDLHIKGKAKIENISNASTDTDKFLVTDGGEIKYRTGAQLLSDIGAAPATGGSYLPLSGGTMTGAIDSTATIGSTNVLQLQSNGGNIQMFSATTGTRLIIEEVENTGITLRSIDGTLTDRALSFATGSSTRMTIKDDGNIGIGTTSPNVLFHVSVNEDGSGIDKGAAKFVNTNTGQGATTMHMVQTSGSNFANAVKFWQGSTPTAVGFIRLTTSATQFITSASDLNLKKNITNWDDNTLDKFKALQPKKFRFKTQDVSENKTLGFIAQNEVDNFPEAYPQFLGDDEKPYYGFNPTGMVPHLMKAIKDLVEKVETLENKITQLENNN